MAQHDDIEKDQYAKIEVLTKTVSELTGAVSVLNKTNTDLTTTLKRALFYQFIVIDKLQSFLQGIMLCRCKFDGFIRACSSHVGSFLCLARIYYHVIVP